MRYDVAVVGGGLAGASTALQLARAGFGVLLLEKQRYPVHKLCGEFLSVEVAGAFERLGVLDAVLAAGAQPIESVCVTTSGGAAFRAPLPGCALGLSRYRLDALLADAARSSGVEVRDGTAVRSVAGSLDDGFRVETDGGAAAARLVVGAYGKRDTLDRKLGRPFVAEHAPRVGFKAHYEGVDLGRVIELHAFRGGYCGLSPVEDGRVNACWICDAGVLKAAGGDPEAMIARVFAANAALAGRFAAMRRVSEAFEAVGQVSFARKGLFDGDVCMVGDAAAMIAPLCGDGMAMALVGAELLAAHAAAFLAGRASPEALRRGYAAAWRGTFGGRLRLGRWLHEALTVPALAGPGVRACRSFPALAAWLIRTTRGPAPAVLSRNGGLD